ncbi:hypothetical protein [Anaerorhabdus sp.]|uniref:hypothetical protein n=1 Tax=Anaerorhabdus sp. TaxID=1872524 RepID=UPI002B20E16C|nr:hypothetical protein [Anaerorhabdus sp.]MEA4875636.1 hypothetical protein [Anaerorhabdus sp.]
MENRVKFRIGDIEFEAEGSAEVVERERSFFSNTLLPAAVEAIVRTREVTQTKEYIDYVEKPIEILDGEANTKTSIETKINNLDMTRTNLASYIKGLGVLTERDFALFASYFDELKNGKEYFTSEDLKKYYLEARRPQPSNISMSLKVLAENGLIMDAPGIEQKSPKAYIVSNDGMLYIQEYQPKQNSERKVTKNHKSRQKSESIYSDVNCDDLNLNKYPEVKTLKDFKEKMMLILYIFTVEGKGEWFTTSDILCIMTDLFGESATKDQINGVFTRERLWFKSEKVEGNSKVIKRKLLNKGLDFAKSLVIDMND